MRYLIPILLIAPVSFAEEQLTIKLKNVEIKPLENIEVEEKPEEITVGVQLVWEL